MATTARQRPGVYSDYDTSGIIWSNGKGKAVGIVALSDAPINVSYTITRTTDAQTIFGNNGDMYQLCKLALQNGALKVIAVSAGTSLNYNYEEAFKVLETQSDIYTVVCDSTSSVVHALLKESVLRSTQVQKERIGIISFGSYDDIKSVLSWAATFNSERMILTAQSPIDQNSTVVSGCFVTAAIAGLISQNVDPTSSFNSTMLRGISRISKILDEDSIDTYILNGLTPLEISLDEASIIRLVTSKTKNGDIVDSTFKDINTILIIDEVIPGLRNVLKNNLLGSKNNKITRSSIATQTVIKLQSYVEKEIIVSYEQPVVTVSEIDATVCIVKVSFTVSHGLNQIIISADIKV